VLVDIRFETCGACLFVAGRSQPAGESKVSGEPRQERLYLRLGLIATVGDLQADAVDQGLPMRGRGST
jgi:hypothetical protein